MKQFFIAVFYLVFQFNANAQGFSKAEYFFDTDPGIGNATSITLSGTINTLNFTANIPTSLSSGFHVLGLRVKNNNGKWSLFEHRAFYISPTPPAGVEITSAEYFIDADPGIGNAVPTPVGTNGAIVNFTINIPTVLAPGFHTVALRTKSSEGKWSLFEHRAFYISPSVLAGVVITAAEYFIDGDPGVGNGVPATVGTNGAHVNFTTNILSSLAPGFHTFAIRTKSSEGKWGLFEHRGFYVSPTALINGNITAAEYFIDADPGVNNGTPITINTPGSLVNQTFNITTLINLAQGDHYVAIRVKNAEGKWSLFNFDTLTINGVLPISELTFTALKENNSVKLYWKTTNEINTSHFNIQRSANGTSFTNFGSVTARNISGNNDYNFRDVNPIDGVNFYRLQMVDIDGKTTYSSIIKILFTGMNGLQVFPNPATNMISLKGLQSNGIFKIMASDGKLVKQISVTASSMLVDISTLAKGMYILQYNNEEKTAQIKIIKQ